MKKFRYDIKNIPPEHDYPAGLVHPYWARKPLNIIEKIILEFSNIGDTVADPFMGSGTTIFASLKNGRNAVGTDLSPISKMLVDSIISSSESPSKFTKILDEAVKDWTRYALHLYALPENMCIERERYLVEGEYANALFSLKLESAKAKPLYRDHLKGKVKIEQNLNYINDVDEKFLNKPIDFSQIKFTENTRIAIHKGVTASNFFTFRNTTFINYAQNYIAIKLDKDDEIDFLKLFLSSMIPLLRLSDKKASSQWPYWRPKTELTSRNPIVAIKRRHKAFINCIDWCTTIFKKEATAVTYNCAADQLSHIAKNDVDLIVTDPPYADHAPYLEYTDLHWSLVGGQRTQSLWSKEIVKTNAVGRERDTMDYEQRLSGAFNKALEILKNDGYLVFFYLDKNINHWQAIKSALVASNCSTKAVIPICKQRRSMKTVTSPGKTLDGDLIIICKKTTEPPKSLPVASLDEILSKVVGNTYFDRFGSFIELFLNHEVPDFKKRNLKDISRIL